MTSINNTGDGSNLSPEKLKEMLESSKVIAVVGISSKPHRPSYGVSAYLQKNGYQIIPVNPRESEVLGEKAYPDLASIPVKVDIVDVFRKPNEAVEIVKESIKIGAKAVWLQESVVSEEAFKIGLEAGLDMVMDRCILKKHNELVG